MSKIRGVFALLVALAVLPAAAQAQERGTITGQVVDQATQQPLVGVQVTVSGTQLGTITNQQGRFLIPNVPVGTRDVRATLIGYSQGVQEVTVAAGQTVTANIALSQSAVAIEGVVVTATGREERTRAIGNAVSQISVQDVELSAVNNMAGLLQGRSAGVTVIQSAGTTGAGARIRIRGSNSVSLSNEPLIVVDGVRINNAVEGSGVIGGAFSIATGGQAPSRLNDINPDDIESIEILKGPAAAAMYGTAAANGVIQITTRRGRAGAARWGFYTEAGLVRDETTYPANVIGYDLPYSDPDADVCPVVYQAEGWCEVAETLRFNTLMNPATTPFTNGHRQKYGLNVSGGGDVTTYYVSSEFEREQGVYAPNRLRRVNLRTNLANRLRDDLTLNINAGYVLSNLGMPQNDNNFAGPLLQAMLGHPDTVNVSNRGYLFTNWQELQNLEADQELGRLTGSFNMNYRPLEWLSVVTTGGLDRVTRHDSDFIGAGLITTLGPDMADGYRTSNRIDVRNITGTLDGTATFSPRSNLLSTSSVGIQYHREAYYDTRAYGVGVVPGTRSLKGTSRLFEVNENTIENATFGAYFQQQLAFNDRLFLTAALRGDQNSAFGTDIGFVTYPSASLSWVVSEEPFFPQVGVLSNLRLRSAYGRSGLKPSFRDAITFYQPVSVRVAAAEVPGITLWGTGDPALRPEVASEFELGFDMGVLDDRLGLEATYYNKQSRDALVRRRIAPSVGATVDRFENIGRVSNVGFETGLRANVLDRRTVQAGFNLTASWTRNRLEELGEGVEPIIFGSSGLPQRHQEGYPLGGYWQLPITWNDANNDGLLQIDEVEQGDSAVYMGNPFPRREASFSPSIGLFNLVRITGLFDYKGGYQLFNFTHADRCSWEWLCEETYNADAADLRQQAGFIAWNWHQRNAAPYLEDADFVKLRELALTFSAPTDFAQRLGFGRMSVTLSGRNLATWTKYSGLDPELNTYGQANFSSMEYYTQPPVRYYTARFDFTF